MTTPRYSFHIPLLSKEGGQLEARLRFLRSFGGRNIDLNFQREGDAYEWFDRACELPGTSFNEYERKFVVDGTLTVEEWWERALDFEVCEGCNLSLKNSRSTIEFFFLDPESKQTFIKEQLTLQQPAANTKPAEVVVL
uniref:Uncharacterized protein n=1 Tax=viral metagenome TaxID=1070528 RepID=A0A6C0CF00_9ZZZZ